MLPEKYEIQYCCPSSIGDGYASGSTRVDGTEGILRWIEEKLLTGKPILITGILHIHSHNR